MRSGNGRSYPDGFWEHLEGLRAKFAVRDFGALMRQISSMNSGRLDVARSQLEGMLGKMKGRARTPTDVAAMKVTQALLDMVWVQMGGRPVVTVTVEETECEARSRTSERL